jgi:hypothetical protein
MPMPVPATVIMAQPSSARVATDTSSTSVHTIVRANVWL